MQLARLAIGLPAIESLERCERVKSLVSILTAFYNEATNLPLLRKRLERVATALADRFDFEFVLIDDHSSDASAELAREWAASDARVHYLRLAHNSGSHPAYTAGLHHARGDCAVLLAADLQDPPETVPELLEQWGLGHDVVWATRAARPGTPWHTRAAAAVYYAVMRRCALPNMPRRGADFLLLDRRVIDAVRTVHERHTSLLGLVLWLGFRQTSIEYVKQPRHSGVTKWTVGRKLKLFADSLLSFSALPVRCIWMFAAVVLSGAVAGAGTASMRWALGLEVPGWVWVLLAVLGIGGLQLGAMGLACEYLWRTYDAARGRPTFVIEEEWDASRTATIRPARRAG